MLKALTKEWIMKPTRRCDGYYVSDDFKVWKKFRTKPDAEVKIHHITTYHKYGKDLTYPFVSIKGKLIGLGKLIYVWFKRDVPEGYEIDHVDGNPFNNNINNLEIVTRRENLLRRKHNGANQWTYKSPYTETVLYESEL